MDKRIVAPEPIVEFFIEAAGFQKSTRLDEWYWFNKDTGEEIIVDHEGVVHVIAGFKDDSCFLELSNDALEAFYSLITLCNCRLVFVDSSKKKKKKSDDHDTLFDYIDKYCWDQVTDGPLSDGWEGED